MSAEKQKNTVSIKDLVESDREFQQLLRGYLQWYDKQIELEEQENRDAERTRARSYFEPIIESVREAYPDLKDTGTVYTGLFDSLEYHSVVEILIPPNDVVTVIFVIKKYKFEVTLSFPDRNARKTVSIDKRGYQNELKIFIAEHMARFERQAD